MTCVVRNLINRAFFIRINSTNRSFMTGKRVFDSKDKPVGIKMQRFESPRTLLTTENNFVQSANVEILPVPDKSDSDKKSYRLIKLENGLTALLISDPSASATDEENDADSVATDNSEKESASGSDSESECEEESQEKLAAASLTVGVGSFSDPRDIQGLAHFLEHMIFMGSEKYPKENEFDAYIKKFGGSDNAMTDSDDTTYYLEVAEKHLGGALDRFSSLFVCPLMHRDAMTREREAVESEFLSKMQGDSIRKEQLLASLGSPTHPVSIFAWGNQKTLKEGIDDDVLYKRVHEFHKRHYSAHRMYLCIQARLSLDELQKMAVEYFGPIPNNNLPGDDFSAFNHANAFLPNFVNKVVYMKPVANQLRLDLTWPIPTLLGEYRCKPQHYVSHLFGYEGKGSLCSYLREKLWALEVVTGVEESGFENNSMYSIFTVSIALTDDGYNEMDQVLHAIFSYLRLIVEAGPIESIFKELQEIEATTFKYQTERNAMDNVEDVVGNLRYFPAKDVLTGSELFFEYNPESIKKIIDCLNQRTFNIMITTKEQNDVVFDKKEKWFGTEYTERDVPQKWIDLWETAKPFPEFHLPEPNRFITTNFEILHKKANATEALVDAPEKIFSNDICELWYRADDKFLLPNAYMYFYFISPMPLKSPLNSCLLNLYSLILKYQLADELYPATVANLDYTSYSSEKGFVVKLAGYNQKLPLLADIITKSMSNFNKNLTEIQFTTMLSQLGKNYYNSFIKPRSLNKEVRLSIVENVHWTKFEKHGLLETIKISQLREFADQFLTEMKIISVMQGNIMKEDAIAVMKNVLNNIPCHKVNDISSVQMRTVQIPTGQNFVLVNSFNDDDLNTFVTNFYQIGPSSIKLASFLDLLIMVIEEPLFDSLRTKEQLGYDVSGALRDNSGILGYSISVNSQEDKFNASHVEQRIEEFRKGFLQILRDMPEEEFAQAKESLIKIKNVIDNELKDEVLRNWGEVTSEEYIFDRRKREVDCLKTISKKDMVLFYDNLISNEEVQRKLSVQIIGHNYSSKSTSNPTERDSSVANDVPRIFELKFICEELRSASDVDYITDIVQFKKTQFVYPLSKTKLD